MGGQPLQCRAQTRIVDPFSGGLEGFGGIFRQVHRMPRRAAQYSGRLDLELDTHQAGKLIEHHQLALQAFLLVTQTGRPMAVSDN